MIDAIASDFRLGVHSSRTRKKGSEELDLRQAAKKLLELSERLEAEQARDEELTTHMTVRVSEQ